MAKVLMCRGINSPLLKCVGTKKDSDFFDNWSLWDGEKMCFCKDCLNKIYDYYLNKSNSDKTALYYTCLQINVPFIQEVYEVIDNKTDKNGKKIPVTINKYITELQRKITKKSLWKDFSETNINLQEKETLIVNNVDNSMKIKWGIQDDNIDYQFLEDTFNRYTEGVEFTNPQQEDLYRDLCRDRLLLRKINDGRYNGEETIDKVQNRISKTMSILKVDQFEQKKKKTDIEKILERQIWEIENTEPAEVVDRNEYADFLNIKKDWGNDILRCVKNLLIGSKEYPNITMDSNKY